MIPGAALLWLGLVGAGAATAQEAAPARRPSTAPLALEGRALYRAACAPCHGLRGDGRGPAARAMEPRPRDFTSGVFKFRSTPSGSLPTDADLYRAISEGVPGTWMPAWEELLSEPQRWALVEYVKTLVPDFQSELANEPPLPLAGAPPPGVSAREGRFVYLALGCWECHGTSGHGAGPSAGALRDDEGRRIRPYDFTREGYKSGGRPEDLYRAFRTGLDGTPMPAYGAEVVLFSGGAGFDLSPYGRILQGEELAAFADYIAGEPDASALAAMPETAREGLVEHRLWSLVEYLQSLARRPGLLYRLFAEDPNATPPRRRP